MSGWDQFSEIAKTRPEDLVKAREIASMFHDTFTTPEGKKALEYMEKIWENIGIVRADDSQFAVGLREGRRDVVRQIKQQIRLAKEGVSNVG